MNEDAIKDGYDYFVKTGYNGTIEDYQQLLKDNVEAFNDTYKHFVETGYNGTVESFQVLTGVTPEPEEVVTEEVVEEGPPEVTDEHVNAVIQEGIPGSEEQLSPPQANEQQIDQNIQVVDGQVSEREQEIDQNTQSPDGEEDVDEESIDQNQQTDEGEVNVDEQEIDQSIPKSSQRSADQKILDYWDAITEEERNWYIKEHGNEQLAQQQIYQEMVEEWTAKNDSYKQEFLDRGQGDEHVAMMLQFQTVEDFEKSDAQMYDYWTDGGTNTLDVSIGDDMDDGSGGTDQLIEPQKVVQRSEKFGGGNALLNTIKNLFKGQDSSGDNKYKRTYYDETEETGKRIDDETKGYITSDDPFTQSLQHIDSELIESTENAVIPLLEYHFGDYGFRFEASDIAGDGMNVYAYVQDENGDWFSKKKYFNLDRLVKKEKTSKSLRDFLSDNKTTTNYYTTQERGSEKEKDYKFHDQGQVDRTVKKMTERENTLRDDIRTYLQQLQSYQDMRSLPGDKVVYIAGPDGEDIATTPNALLIDLNYQKKKLQNQRENIIITGEELDKDIGLWYMMRGQEGTRSGGFFQNMIAGGGSDIGAFGMDFVIDAGVSIAHAIDPDATGGLTPDQMKKQIKLGQDQQDGEGYERAQLSPFSEMANKVTARMDQEKGMVTGSEAAFDWMYGGTNREYINQKMTRENIYVEDHPFSDPDLTAEEKGWWEWVGGMGFYGAARSIPAMVGPGKVRILNMGGQVYTHLQKEMAGNEFFDSISEGEKKLFSIPLAVVVGVLENLGFRNMKQMTSISSKVLMNILGKGGKDVTGKTFAQVVKAEVNNLIAQGVIRVTNAGVAEFETGFMQELADITFKSTYNWIQDADAFATPQSTGEFFDQLLVGATSEMIGGFVIGTPGAIVYAAGTGDFTKVSDDTFKVFDQVHNQQPVKDAFVSKIKEKILSGEMTKEQGDKDIAAYDQVSGVMSQIPTDLPLQQKKELLGNLLRQQELNDYIDKYNKQLTKRQQRELLDLESKVDKIIIEGNNVNEATKKEKALTERAMHELINSGVENPTPEEINKKKKELADGSVNETSEKGKWTKTITDGNEITTYTVEVTEDHAKEELQKEGIKNPTQEQINKKQSELMEKGKEQAELQMKGKKESDHDQSEEIENQREKERDAHEKKYYTLDKENQKSKDKGEAYSYSAENLNEGFTLEEAQEESNAIEAKYNKLLTENNKQDAIQESSTESVDVQVQTEDGGQVGTSHSSGTTAPKSKVESKTDTKSKKKTKVSPELEEEVGDLEVAVSDQTGVPTQTETETETESEVNTTREAVVENSQDGTIDVIVSNGKNEVYEGSSVSNNVHVSQPKNAKPESNPDITFANLVKQAVNAGKSVAKLITDLNIVVHSSEGNYNKAVLSTNAGTRGTFNLNTNTIHINGAKANTRTVAHEIMHAVLLKQLGINSKEFNIVTRKMLDAALRGIKDPKIKKELEKFANDYATEDQNEEKVAELFGMLADNYTKFDRPTKNVIKRWLQIVAEKIGIPVSLSKYTKSDRDIIDFFHTVSGKVRTGEEVEESDVEVITKKPKKKPKKETKDNDRIKEIDKRVKEINELIGELSLDSNGNQIKKNMGRVQELATERAKLLLEKNRIESGTETSKKKTEPKKKTESKKKTPIVPGHHIMLINELLKLAGYKNGMSATEHSKLKETPEGRVLDKLITKLMKESNTYEEALEKLSNLPFDSYSSIVENTEVITDPLLKALKDYQHSQDVWTDQEIEDAHESRDAELASLEQQESGLLGSEIGYVFQRIHSYFHGITQKDFDHYGDRNLRNRAINFLLRKNASPLDTQAQEVSEIAGVEITEQDFIDYILDRTNNPGKYVQSQEKAQQAGVDKLMNMYQMNPKGFIGPNIYSLADLKTWANRLGFGVGTARVRDKNAYDYGRLTGYYLTQNGKFVNPRSSEKAQKVMDEKAQRVFNKEDSPLDIINTARDQNFTDAAIRDYLTRVRDFGKREVDMLLKVQDEVLKTLPSSLGNVEGGMLSGINLYNRIFKKYYQLQRQNIKSKIKKSQEEIMDETMDFVRSQPEFKKLSDKGSKILSTKQRVLEIDIARALGGKQSSDLSASIKNSRLILNSKKLGQKELKEAQRELRNFLRRVLPKSIYTKPEVNTLLRKISETTVDNIQNVQNEILEFAAEKNNTRLEESIEKLLNPKDRIKINNILKGVKIDDSTRKRLQIIRKRLNPKGGLKTEDKVLEYLSELQQEYNEINENPSKSDAHYEALSNLQIIMSLVNATHLMDNKDISKVSSLSQVETMLKDIIVTGQTLLKQQLKEAHLEYRRQFEEVYKDITGRTESFEDQAKRELKEEGIIEPTPDQIQSKITDIIETIKQKQPDLNDAASKKNRISGIALHKRAQNLVNSVFRTLGNIMSKNSDMFLLMDKISKLPANLFEGVTQKEVTDRIDKASRMFKERMLMNEAFITFKWQELYGKRYKKKVATFTRRILTGIYKDAEAVKKAQQIYESNPTPENQKNVDDVIAQNEQELSANQMYYLYNQFKDPRNHPGFETQFGPEYQRVMQEMTDLLAKDYSELKEFADWQVDILFPMLYQHYNEAYKDIYRIDMPYNIHYGGMVYRELGKGETQDQGIDLLSGTPQYHNTVSSNSTKMRQDNKRAIRKDVDGTNALFTYMRDMEYFAAYARPVSDINKLFTNPIIYDTIKRLYGEETNNVIQASIKKVANKGMSKSDAQMDNAVNIMQDVFILSRLGINPVVTLKQLTSFVTYANDLGPVTWMKNAALSRFFKGGQSQSVKQVWKEISENSVYLKDRQKQSITKAIEAYTDERMIEVMPEKFGMSGHTRESLINILMYTTRLGDIGAIYLGGVPNYVHYKQQALKAGKTEQQSIDIAIRKFEKDTKRTQQSTDLQDRDYFQNKDAINRALNMFLTTPKQYLRKEVYAIRNLYRILGSGGKQGKGTLWENTRTFITYHFVMPMLFQWVSNGFPGLLADWDEEDGSDLFRASVLGNINALFIYGEFVEKFAYYLQGKPKGFLEFKNLPIITQTEEVLSKLAAYRDAKDPVKKQEKLYKALREISQFTGMPTNNLYKIFKNLEALSDGEGGDPAKIIMRLFNFSEYQIYNEEERAENRKEMMKGVNERTRDRMRKEGKIGPKKKKTTKKKKKNTKPKSNGNPMEMINPMESDNPMSQDNPMDSDNPMLDDNPME